MIQANIIVQVLEWEWTLNSISWNVLLCIIKLYDTTLYGIRDKLRDTKSGDLNSNYSF